MSSILDDIDNIINEGDSHVVKTKLFETFYNGCIREYKSSHPELLVKKIINDRRRALEHLTVGDLYKYFYLNELEIRQFCSNSSFVKNVQNTLYSFSVPEGQGLTYYHGKYTCNLDNALYALTGGTFVIEIDDVDCGRYLIDVKSTPACVRDFVLNSAKKCHIALNTDFFEDLEKYCCKKLNDFVKKS